MNEYEMVVFIVALVMGTVLLTSRWKYKYGGKDGGHREIEGKRDPEAAKEIEKLRERVNVLERIAVEKEDHLTRQIEQLRDR